MWSECKVRKWKVELGAPQTRRPWRSIARLELLFVQRLLPLQTTRLLPTHIPNLSILLGAALYDAKSTGLHAGLAQSAKPRLPSVCAEADQRKWSRCKETGTWTTKDDCDPGLRNLRRRRERNTMGGSGQSQGRTTARIPNTTSLDTSTNHASCHFSRGRLPRRLHLAHRTRNTPSRLVVAWSRRGRRPFEAKDVPVGTNCACAGRVARRNNAMASSGLPWTLSAHRHKGGSSPAMGDQPRRQVYLQ